MPDARMISAKEEDFLKTNSEICDTLFKDKEWIDIHDFLKIQQDIKLALWHYEFYQYEVEPDTESITLEDFAKSLLICLPHN